MRAAHRCLPALIACLYLLAAGCSDQAEPDQAEPDIAQPDAASSDTGPGLDVFPEDRLTEDAGTSADADAGTDFASDTGVDTDSDARSDAGNKKCAQLAYSNEQVCAQSCTIPHDVHIYSRADLARVARLGCDVIDGNLFVESTPLVDLAGLEAIRAVTGGVYIEGNDGLQTIAGLASLQKTSALYVRDNAALEHLDSHPITWASDVRIENNASLEGLEGLSALEDATFLWIEHNPSLVDLSGLRSVASPGWLSITDNDALVDLQGLDNLERVDGQCHGSNGGGLYISDNERLTTLDGLEGLSSSAMGVAIHDNPSLTDITALSGLRDIGNCAYAVGFSLENNDALTNLDGFNLTELQKVDISNNDALTSLDALSSLTSAQRLSIEDNDRLTDVDGLHNLREVGYPTGGRASTSLRGGLYIIGNQRLADLDGLSALGSGDDHRGHITIADNPMLADITGLSGLTKAGQLVVRNNDALRSLSGLDGLRQLDNGLTLEQNAVLSSADALLGLDSLGSLRVVDNPKLPACYASAIASTVAPDGEVEIRGNGDGACP